MDGKRNYGSKKKCRHKHDDYANDYRRHQKPPSLCAVGLRKRNVLVPVELACDGNRTIGHVGWTMLRLRPPWGLVGSYTSKLPF